MPPIKNKLKTANFPVPVTVGIRDISLHKDVEKHPKRMATKVLEKTIALKRAIEERRRIFEESRDLILVGAGGGTIMRVSRSSAQILGYQPDEMPGRNAGQFIYQDD